MQLERLALHNFRCYLGDHEIDLSVPGASKLIIVFGENMRGKTTLLQALRWGLYDVANDREGYAVPIYAPEGKEQLLSIDAVARADFDVMVEIGFTHEGERFELRRRAWAGHDCASDADFAREVSLRVDGSVLAESRVQPRIETVLSDEVSRFFLFDGEMLTEYERLLRDENDTAVVRHAIESILGLPSLNVHRELGELAAAAEKRVNDAVRKEERYTALVGEVELGNNELRSLIAEVKRLENDLETARRERTTAEETLKRQKDIEKDIKEIELRESDVDSAKRDLALSQERLRTLLTEAWWLPIATQAATRLEALDNQAEVQAERDRIERRIGNLETTLNGGICELCGVKLDTPRRATLKDELNHRRLELAGLPAGEGIDELLRRRRVYGRFSSPGAIEKLRASQENLTDAEGRIAAAETRAQEIRERISDRVRGDMEVKTKRWQRLVEQAKKFEDALTTKQAAVEIKEAEVAKKQKLMTRSGVADPALSAEAELLRELTEIFRAAVDRFRDELRRTVEGEADQIFKQLTTEAAYAGLQINRSVSE